MYRALRTSELRKLSETNKTAASVLSSANTVFVPVGKPGDSSESIPQSSCKVFTKEISKTDNNWVEYGKYYKYRILKNEYDMSNINGIDVERKAIIDNEECYENIMFSYKKYATGVIAIVLSEPDNIKIIIKGE